MNEDGFLRIASVFELMNVADDDAVLKIMDVAVNDNCELVRHEAIFALGEMAPSEKIVSFLKDRLVEDDSLVVKHECLMSLGTIGTEEDILFIEPYVDSDLFEIKCSAQASIDRIRQIEDFETEVCKNVDKYISILHDKKTFSQNTRIQILFQLMKVGVDFENSDSDKVIEAIGKSLKEDICRVVRHEAGFVLGEIGTDRAVEIMKEALINEKTPITVHEVLFALGTSGNKLALPIIERFLDDENYVVSESAVIAKSRILKLDEPYSGARHFK